jgi:hypothetical protein
MAECNEAGRTSEITATAREAVQRRSYDCGAKRPDPDRSLRRAGSANRAGSVK